MQLKDASSEPKYLVRALEPHEWLTWDSFVGKSPQGTLFHTTKWLTTSGQPFYIYGCFRQEELIGGIVFDNIGVDAAGQAHNSMYLGPVLPPPLEKYLTTLTYHRNILAALASDAKNRFRLIKCQMAPEIMDVQPFIWAGYSIIPRYTYRIDLRDLAVAWRNMEDKRRNDIRKAERDGITVDRSGSIQDVLSLEQITFERQGLTFKFDDIAIRRERSLRAENRCRCFIARDKTGAPLGGAYIVWDDRCAYYLLGGYAATRAHRGAGALAVWDAMRYASNDLGVECFDFTGSIFRPIERFFRDFGGLLTPTYVITWERSETPSIAKDISRVIRALKKLPARWFRSADSPQ